jgi:hypothetical protein
MEHHFTKFSQSSSKVTSWFTVRPVIFLRFLPASPLYGATSVKTNPDRSALGSGPSVFLVCIESNQMILMHLVNDVKTQNHNEESGVISCEPPSLDPHIEKPRHSLLNPTEYQ